LFKTPAWARVTTGPDGKWLCDRPWPPLELFMPMALLNNPRDARYYEYETLFLRSLLLFWQLDHMNASIRLLFDEEFIPQRRGVYDMIVDTFKPYRRHFKGGMEFTATQPSANYHTGSERQQLMMFWADNFTAAEYVAFVDSDSVFLTMVDREDLFEDGKPVINGKSGPSGDAFWQRGPMFSYSMTGREEVMRCMSYFPVVIKTAHLKELREHVVRQHGGNMTFDQIYFGETATLGAFQFNVMCTYLFYYKQDEYKFYAHPTMKLPWDGISPAPDPGMVQNYSLFDNNPNLVDIYEPKPRIATHSRYRGWKSKYMMQIGQSRQHMNMLMQQGICISPPLVNSSDKYHVSYTHRDDPICENITFFQKPGMNGIHTVQELGYYEEMHIFEFLDWSTVVPEAKLRAQYHKRIERIAHCDMKFNADGESVCVCVCVCVCACLRVRVHVYVYVYVSSSLC